MTERVTASLDADSIEALETLCTKTDSPQSEIVRRALTFYATNFEAANGHASDKLGQHYQMLMSGEHVLLDIDFFHVFLEYCYADGDPEPELVQAIDRVSDYHAREYATEFETIGDLLTWLSFCGFLEVQRNTEDTYHVIFPSEATRWFATRFIERSTVEMPLEIDIERGVLKAIIIEQVAN
ncbi:ribbon-helix-helix protein, CopG family [Natrononativus amylolyticus]|uniref:ribbon-helix-helix protein, CopG family n=1 Tax=Natrononativus amylolyticus TaxID=2963434 RepID=UPI0020CCBE32|nr:ribbon-helix-helix protein, CopG family [Natrononativus amylolyticus]